MSETASPGFALRVAAVQAYGLTTVARNRWRELEGVNVNRSGEMVRCGLSPVWVRRIPRVGFIGRCDVCGVIFWKEIKRASKR